MLFRIGYLTMGWKHSSVHSYISIRIMKAFSPEYFRRLSNFGHAPRSGSPALAVPSNSASHPHRSSRSGAHHVRAERRHINPVWPRVGAEDRAMWWHCQQLPDRDRTPRSRMLRSVIEIAGADDRGIRAPPQALA